MYLRLILSIVCTLISAIAHSQTLPFPQENLFRLLNPEDAEQLILVVFADKHINRIQRATSSSAYRRRGPYKSSTWSQRVSNNIAQDYNLQKLVEWPMSEVEMHCIVYQVSKQDAVEQVITQIARDRRVQIVQKMHLFSTQGRAYNDPYFELQSNMHAMQIDRVHGKTTGRNVTIAIVDTGVDMSHPDLLGQVMTSENFASSISSSFAEDMHGTAVAGIIAARKNNRAGIIGVAPDAKLMALKACWPNQVDSLAAYCNSFTLAMALNTAIKSDAKILNLSLAGPEDPLLSILLKRAMAQGIIVVAADPGAAARQQNFPASLENVIAVRILEPQHDKALKMAMTVNAQGDAILTTLPHATYDFISGSSLAAAQVSGIIALLLELKPDLTAYEIWRVLSQAESLEDSEDTQRQSRSINANSAVHILCKSNTCLIK